MAIVPIDVAGSMLTDSIFELVGHTPLLRLRGIGTHYHEQHLAKLEMFNPGGSAKDRIALRMVADAERRGELSKGSVIIDATSGNTGVGLAMVGCVKGYRVIMVVSEKASSEKLSMLRAFGAEVVIVPAGLPPEHPQSLSSTVDNLMHSTPRAWCADQFNNISNPKEHEQSTGVEIWEQTAGMVTHLVAGVGTGGMVSGAGRFLKEVSGGRVQVVVADPNGSAFAGGDPEPYLVEGVGSRLVDSSMWPQTFDKDIVDRYFQIPDSVSFDMVRRVAKSDGILIGLSSGMVAAAAQALAEEQQSDAGVIVSVFMDSGRSYLSKLFP